MSKSSAVVFAGILSVASTVGQGYLTYLCSLLIYNNYSSNPLPASKSYNWEFAVAWISLLGMYTSIFISGTYMVLATSYKLKDLIINCEIIGIYFATLFLTLLISVAIATIVGGIVCAFISINHDNLSGQVFYLLECFAIVTPIFFLVLVLSVPSIKFSLFVSRYFHPDEPVQPPVAPGPADPLIPPRAEGEGHVQIHEPGYVPPV
ncbi:MAG: hypothetical protein Edafosvirus2_5 [Edafosvirus sp.]|uniref:Uncharacterized protein n=1 Tax=Edafosvirus sp. TaxID=2487765 RepID=A0A3G4ZSF4_9VIRU|nr:MAG: hypothetical protein Edafosvirus2_5 [Edafosvirus sp.]